MKDLTPVFVTVVIAGDGFSQEFYRRILSLGQTLRIIHKKSLMTLLLLKLGTGML
jgi:hypothetical protein